MREKKSEFGPLHWTFGNGIRIKIYKITASDKLCWGKLLLVVVLVSLIITIIIIF